MNKAKLRLALFVASICLCVSSWAERVAPTFPEFTTFEAGKSFCLYNVEESKFIGSDEYGSIELSDYGQPLEITEASEGFYYFRFTLSGNEYSMSYNTNYDGRIYFTYGYGTPYYYEFSILKNNDDYLIKANDINDYFNDNASLGYNGENFAVNMTEGSIHWQFVDAEVAKHYFARHKLYTALEASDIYNYPTEYYEAIYENSESTTEELEKAAATLNNGVTHTQKYQSPEWSEYTVLFGEGVCTNSSTIQTNTIYNLGETTSITATVNVDKNATLIYDTNSSMSTSVYIDGKMVRSYQIPWSSYRFFESLSVGSHHIEWRFENNSGSQQKGGIEYLGIVNTPATISVSLLEPGSLGTEVLNHVDHIKDVRCLKISGKMNDDDWAKINMMTNLQSLDLSDAIVTKIPDRQFRKTYDKWMFLHKIELPNILEIIGDDAFYDSHVETLTFPSTLKEIGSYAFYNSKITEAILPDNMTNIRERAFENCTFLVSVNYPNELNYVPDHCFYNCENLNTFELHNGITRIGGHAFENAKNFIATLPETLTALGVGAFQNSGTVNLYIPEVLTEWERTNSGYNHAFSYNTKLISAEFPTSFYKVDVYGTLINCSNLETVTFKSPTVVAGEYKNSFLDGCTSHNLTLRVPSFLVNSYKLDEYWYNYNIEGFNTADIKDWNVRGNLVLNNRERIDGTPNLFIAKTGSVKINGENAQNIDNLEVYVDHYNTIYDYVSNQRDYAFGKILVNNDATTISGECVHHHYVDAKKWYFISLPFDIKVNEITNNSEARMAIRYYDGATRASEGVVGNWKDYAEDAVIEAGTGFIVQTSVATTLTFRALDNESKQNIVSNEEFKKALAANASGSMSDKGWNLVGNPWQCYFNIHTLNFTAPITVYDVYNKTYVAYSIIDDDYAIRPNEAFFVQCPEGTELISFPQSGRQLTSVITNQSAARPMYSQASSRQLIDITVSADKYTDKTRVVLNETSTLGYETSYDACKFMTMENGVPQIYTIDSEETEYAINERPLDKGIVKLGVVVSTSGTHRISMPRNEAGSVILIDHKAGVKHDLLKGDYEFTAEAGTYNSRFTLNITKSSETGIEGVEIADGALECDGNNILVNGIKGNVSVYTVDGRKVAETCSNGNVSFNNMPQGIYIVRTVQGTGKVTVK